MESSSIILQAAMDADLPNRDRHKLDSNSVGPQGAK